MRSNPWRQLLYHAKIAGKKNLQYFKKKNIFFDLTWRDLEKQFKKQKERCYWFGIKLDPFGIFKKDNPLAISVDRLDNLLYYSKNNIVVCCRLANLGRNRCTKEEFRKIANKLKREI